MKLDIQLFASGTVNFTASGKLQGRIVWSSTGDTTTNKSSVTVKLYARRTDSAETYGKSWNGYITIDGSKSSFSSLSSSTSVSDSWVLMHTYTKEITHDTDGTKSIIVAGSITGPSGTSLSGNTSKGSFTATLDTLHKAPSDITYSIQEGNQKLTDAGVLDNVFVEEASSKKFMIDAIFYDNAQAKKYIIYNRNTSYPSDSSSIILDFKSLTLLKDSETETKIPIKIGVVDNFGAVGYSSEDLYEFIPYRKMRITDINTNVKRNGQLSGKAYLNVNGTFYNGVVGTIDQTEYKPVIKYKFWESNAEEPSTYDYTIPEENVFVSTNKFSVSNFEIGTTDETAINWFNPEKAYRIKIYAEDNLTSTNSLTKTLFVGEATWTEYKDRVDFKNLTIKGLDIAEYVGGIESQDLSENGYVRFKRGLQLAWITQEITTSMTLYGNVYYSDHSLKDWPTEFTSVYFVVPVDTSKVYWCTIANVSNANAGEIRLYKPNASGSTTTITVLAIGTWK